MTIVAMSSCSGGNELTAERARADSATTQRADLAEVTGPTEATTAPESVATDEHTAVSGPTAVAGDAFYPSLETCPRPDEVSLFMGLPAVASDQDLTKNDDDDYFFVTCNYLSPNDDDVDLVATIQFFNSADPSRELYLDNFREQREGYEAVGYELGGAEVYESRLGGCWLTGIKLVVLVSPISNDDMDAACTHSKNLFTAFLPAD